MTERELSRAAARRLAIIRHAEEVTGNVALTCRYYGISRTLYYTWRRRYEELGIDGLRPRSRRPLASPNATSGEVIGKIVHLPQLHGAIPLPPAELIAAFATSPELDEPVAFEAAVDARASWDRIDADSSELVADPPRSPPGVLAAQLADHRFDLGGDLVWAGDRTA